jgi:integrase
MRKSEILSLKWGQIRNGFVYLVKTKTGKRREIPINNELASLFRQIREEQGYGGLIDAKREQELSSRYVFSYPGRSDRMKNINAPWWAALKKAKIDNFHFHDLRHTFATYLVMRGATLKDVQELLGHETANMTLRYAHLSQEHKRNAVNLLNGITGQESKPMSQNVTNQVTHIAKTLK